MIKKRKRHQSLNGKIPWLVEWCSLEIYCSSITINSQHSLQVTWYYTRWQVSNLKMTNVSHFFSRLISWCFHPRSFVVCHPLLATLSKNEKYSASSGRERKHSAGLLTYTSHGIRTTALLTPIYQNLAKQSHCFQVNTSVEVEFKVLLQKQSRNIYYTSCSCQGLQ